MKYTPKQFAARFNLSEKDFDQAATELWTVENALEAMYALTRLTRSEVYQEEASDANEIVQLMRQLLSFTNDQFDEMASAMESVTYKDSSSQIVSFKEASGHWRWVLITGSAFEDRDGEIISEKAYEGHCDEMELTGDYGELLWYHCDGELHAALGEKETRPYLPLGSCDTSFMFEKQNIESGLYYDDGVGETMSAKAKELGASKAFWHRPGEPVDGVYSYIRNKERSLLPRSKESNLLTRLFGHKEKEMADNNSRVAALKEKLGEDKLNAVLAVASKQKAKAEQFLKSKEATDAAPATEEKKPETPTVDLLAEALADFAQTKEVKVVTDQLQLALKEQKAAADKAIQALTEKNAALEVDMAELQLSFANLMGIQPKNEKGFRASEAADTKTTPEGKNKESAEKVGDVAKEKDAYVGVMDWLITGERAPAA